MHQQQPFTAECDVKVCKRVPPAIETPFAYCNSTSVVIYTYIQHLQIVLHTHTYTHVCTIMLLCVIIYYIQQQYSPYSQCLCVLFLASARMIILLGTYTSSRPSSSARLSVNRIRSSRRFPVRMLYCTMFSIIIYYYCCCTRIYICK